MSARGTWQAEVTSFRQLESGYVHIRGHGPCNWAQPPRWPCEPAVLAGSIFAEAGGSFRRAVMFENERVNELHAASAALPVPGTKKEQP